MSTYVFEPPQASMPMLETVHGTLRTPWHAKYGTQTPFHPAIILHRLSSGAQRDAAQQRIAGVFIPVRTWPDRMVCSHGWPTGFLADPLGRRFELLDERSETRRHRLRYSVVLDPKPSSNCQQLRSLI